MKLRPDLEELEVRVDIDFEMVAFSVCLKGGDPADPPLQLLAPPMPPAEPTVPHEELELPDYTDNVGKAYRNQAMELTSICRALMSVKEQAFNSNDELRRSCP